MIGFVWFHRVASLHDGLIMIAYVPKGQVFIHCCSYLYLTIFFSTYTMNGCVWSVWLNPLFWGRGDLKRRGFATWERLADAFLHQFVTSTYIVYPHHQGTSGGYRVKKTPPLVGTNPSWIILCFCYPPDESITWWSLYNYPRNAGWHESVCIINASVLFFSLFIVRLMWTRVHKGRQHSSKGIKWDPLSLSLKFPLDWWSSPYCILLAKKIKINRKSFSVFFLANLFEFFK